MTAPIAGLLAVAAGSGLFLDVYGGETAFARNGYRGADLVSLAVAVPLLVVTAGRARRGSARGLLVWLGGLAYVVYQYGYTFAYGWSRLFPVYLVLLSLSGFTLVRALLAIDADALAAGFDDAAPTRTVGNYLWFVAAGLGLMELAQILAAVITGDPPQIVVDTGHPTSPVYILDLGLIVPLMVLGGSWLRAKRPWGYVAGVILLIKGTAVGLGLLSANLFALVDGGTTDGPLIGLWVAIAVGSAYFLWRLLTHLDRPEPAVVHVPDRKET